VVDHQRGGGQAARSAFATWCGREQHRPHDRPATSPMQYVAIVAGHELHRCRRHAEPFTDPPGLLMYRLSRPSGRRLKESILREDQVGTARYLPCSDDDPVTSRAGCRVENALFHGPTALDHVRDKGIAGNLRRRPGSVLGSIGSRHAGESGLRGHLHTEARGHGEDRKKREPILRISTVSSVPQW